MGDDGGGGKYTFHITHVLDFLTTCLIGSFSFLTLFHWLQNKGKAMPRALYTDTVFLYTDTDTVFLYTDTDTVFLCLYLSVTMVSSQLGFLHKISTRSPDYFVPHPHICISPSRQEVLSHLEIASKNSNLDHKRNFFWGHLSPGFRNLLSILENCSVCSGVNWAEVLSGK